MTSYRDIFPPNWISSENLAGATVVLTIRDVRVEVPFDNGKQLPVLYFGETSSKLALNKTNAKTLGDLYGEHMEEWRGKKIELYCDETVWQGEQVSCVRLRGPSPRMTDDHPQHTDYLQGQGQQGQHIEHQHQEQAIPSWANNREQDRQPQLQSKKPFVPYRP